ncbi:MAG: GNAT family N-acetyltransferase [Thermoleophilaceae bacterium]|nr:GNAT family N-acetyltransferase [Thermoleophilaceae bacterium]
MEVRGPTLTLRLPEERDVQALFELGRDPEVVRYFSWGPYESEEEPRAYVADLARQRDAGERLEFAICRDDVPIGITGLSDFSLRDRRAIVGTWLGRDHWGTGANKESKAMMLTLAFGPLGLQRVSALASPANARSLVALARLGFAEEGVLRGWQVHDGERKDVAILRMLVEDWRAGPLASVPVEVAGEPPAQFTP